LSGSIQPGAYYLVQESQGAGGTTALPAPGRHRDDSNVGDGLDPTIATVLTLPNAFIIQAGAAPANPATKPRLKITGTPVGGGQLAVGVH